MLPLVTLSLRKLLALGAALLTLAYGLVWLWAASGNDERLRTFRQSVREQGPARGGRPPTDDEAKERTEELATSQHVRVIDVTVEHEDVDGAPSALSATQAGAAVMGAVQVRSRQYTVRGRAQSRTLWFTRDEPFELQFAVRLSVTMPSSMESRERAVPSEAAGSRGL
jgi:hypothetical protein